MGSSLIRTTTQNPLVPGLPPGAYPLVMLRSPIIDLTQATTTVIPGAMPGFVFIPNQARFLSTVKTGTATAGITIKAGNDASNVNFIPSVSIASTFFSATATPTYDISFVTAAVPTQLVDLATPISVVITSAATGTGGFAWKGYIGMIGYLMPAS